MPNLKLATHRHPPESVSALRPSEYTAALIQALRARPDWAEGGRVLEIGSGSGVVLAALAGLGAASLCGIDIEDEAVDAGLLLLGELGHGSAAELHQGDMWQPVEGRRFDVIAANLPQFPMERGGFTGRLSTWSCGGPTGRSLLDRFLGGLAAHLAPRGRAVITHNAFVGVDETRAMAAESGLSLRIAATMLVHIPAEKLALMTRNILRAELARSIHRYGPYAFADMHLVEIGFPGTLD